MLTKAQKRQIIDDLAGILEDGSSVIFTDHKGISVSDISRFRRSLREVGGRYKVMKKRLISLAIKRHDISLDPKALEGEIGLVLGGKDEIIPSKASYRFSKDRPNFRILGGIIQKQYVGSEEILRLATLPSREILISKAVGSISSPLSGILRVLSGNARNLTFVLKAIGEKKQT